MIYSYCTLFDSNYLDKGIVLVNSLKEQNDSCKIYILCMDAKCYEVVSTFFANRNVISIRLEEFLNEELSEVKKKRNKAEFCWTCTASLIEYIFINYDELYCTYIDADMFFFSNPDMLVDEMIENGKSVQIIEHRFRLNNIGKRSLKESGRFCVEFNTFKNDKAGRKVLNGWKKDTIRECSVGADEKSGLGDQCYLELWPEKYNCVHIMENLGAGLAPWNIDRYALREHINDEDGTYVSFDGKGRYKVFFYHFHNLMYLSPEIVDIDVFRRYYKLDKQLVYKIYIPYLKKLDKAKDFLRDTYNVYPLVKRHPGIEKEKSVIYYLKKIFSKQIIQTMRMRIDRKIKDLNSHGNDYIKVKELIDCESYVDQMRTEG